MQSACSITRFDPEPRFRRLDFSAADHYTPGTFRILGSSGRSHYAVLHRGLRFKDIVGGENWAPKNV